MGRQLAPYFLVNFGQVQLLTILWRFVFRNNTFELFPINFTGKTLINNFLLCVGIQVGLYFSVDDDNAESILVSRVVLSMVLSSLRLKSSPAKRLIKSSSRP